MRKFKITCTKSHTVHYVSTQSHLERTLSDLARKAHPRTPVSILVQDITEEHTPMKLGGPD